MVVQSCVCTKCYCSVHCKMVKMVNFMLCVFYHKDGWMAKGIGEDTAMKRGFHKTKSL